MRSSRPLPTSPKALSHKRWPSPQSPSFLHLPGSVYNTMKLCHAESSSDQAESPAAPGEVGGGSAGRSTAGDSGAEVGSGKGGRLGEGSSDALKVRGLEKVEATKEAKQTAERLTKEMDEQREREEKANVAAEERLLEKVKELAELGDNCRETRERLEVSESELLKTSEALGEALKENLGWQRRMEQLKMVLEDLEGRWAASLLQVQLMEEQIEEERCTMAESNAEMEALNCELNVQKEELQKQNENLSASLEHEKSKVTCLEEAVLRGDLAMKDLETTVSTSYAELQSLQDSEVSLRKDLDVMSQRCEEQEALREELSSVRFQLQQQEEQLRSCRASLEGATAEHQGLEERLAATVAELEQCESQAKRQRSELQQLEEQTKTLSDCVQGATAEIEGLRMEKEDLLIQLSIAGEHAGCLQLELEDLRQEAAAATEGKLAAIQDASRTCLAKLKRSSAPGRSMPSCGTTPWSRCRSSALTLPRCVASRLHCVGRFGAKVSCRRGWNRSRRLGGTDFYC